MRRTIPAFQKRDAGAAVLGKISIEGNRMKIVDRIFSVILIFGGLLHGMGSFVMYKNAHMTLLWSLCAALLTVLIATINLLRVQRPSDRALAWICFVSSLSWAVAAFTAGVLIGSIFDWSPMMHWVTALVLAGFSLRTALAPGNVKVRKRR
jgi:membrane protein DedA with SNARE-associated domain